VNDELFAHAAPEAIFMHCLPAHRGEEVTDSIMESGRSVVFDEAEIVCTRKSAASDAIGREANTR